MKDANTSGIDDQPHSRMMRLAVTLAMLIALVVAWYLYQKPQVPDSRAILVADRPWSIPLGRVRLHSKLVSEKVDRSVLSNQLDYHWRASQGVVVGKGARVSWIAPEATGLSTITVSINNRAEESETVYQASIELKVIAYPGESQATMRNEGSHVEKGRGYEIGSVSFDKDWICANDDVLVQVEAWDPFGDASWLLPEIVFPGHTASGSRTVARIGYLMESDLPETQTVEVRLRDLRTRKIVATREIPFTVEDCQSPGAGLKVTCTRGELRDDQVKCEADLQRAPAGFSPVRYRWTIEGDTPDQPVETTRPWVRRSVPGRLQTAAIDTYIIRVQAFDAHAQSISGRGVYVQDNAYWRLMQKTGKLQLRVRFDAQPKRDGDTYFTDVVITNHYSEPIALDSLEALFYQCSDSGETQQTVVDSTVSAASVLGTDFLEPGETVQYRWFLPVDPRRCGARALLKGYGENSDLPATAQWLMPTDPGSEQSVADPSQLALLQRAMQILSERRKKPVHQVSEVELGDLLREGVISAIHLPK